MLFRIGVLEKNRGSFEKKFYDLCIGALYILKILRFFFGFLIFYLILVPSILCYYDACVTILFVEKVSMKICDSKRVLFYKTRFFMGKLFFF